jgi:hypothetical protein
VVANPVERRFMTITHDLQAEQFTAGLWAFFPHFFVIGDSVSLAFRLKSFAW